MSHDLSPTLTRRDFVAATAAATATGGVALTATSAVGVDTRSVQGAGFEKKPVTCFVCGANCGLTALYKVNAPLDDANVVMLPNHKHPQRGLCGRGAASMWFWNHPLRLKKPLKRVGERGEGRFEPIEWGQALDEIAGKLKAVVEKHGERGVALTSHDLTGIAQFFGFALGTTNIVNHAATCQTAGTIARRWTFADPFNANNRTDPDYENARYVLFIGRTLQASMGAQARLATAKSKGAQVVFVDPRMPEGAMAGAEWVPIVPGTDTAFALALAHVMLQEKLFDADFLGRFTTLPFLIKPDGMPVTQADLVDKGDVQQYALWDPVSAKPALVGVQRNDKGEAVAYTGAHELQPQLDYTGELTLVGGTRVPVTTAFNLLVQRCAAYAPAEAAGITGVSADTLTRIARDFAKHQGVCDDSWYNSRNGNDFDACRSMLLLNALVGNLDKAGGLCFTGSAGVGGFVNLNSRTGEVKNILGASWSIEPSRRIDAHTYPESNGTFDAVYTAMLEGKPYPVRALFVVGTTLVYRDANTERVKQALKALDLLVVQDILPHEVCDYADYVLPASYFMERSEVLGTKWTMHTAIQYSTPLLQAPPGCQGRDDMWMLMDVLRRAYPERAERAGWKTAWADYAAYKAQCVPAIDAARLKPALARVAERDPEAPARIERELKELGYAVVGRKRYNGPLLTRPLATPSGRMEVYALRGLLNERIRDKVAPLPDYQPIKAYKLPSQPDEFYLISGKNPSNGSGTAVFGWPGKSVGDRTVWMHPSDAQRLNIRDGQLLTLQGLDNGIKGNTRVTLTNRVKPGVLFAYGFSNGFRGKLGASPKFAFMEEGVNTHWFATGYAEPVIGNMANNVSVRVSVA